MGGSSTHEVWEHPRGSHPLGAHAPASRERAHAQEPPLQQNVSGHQPSFLREGWIRPREDNAKKTHKLIHQLLIPKRPGD